MTIRRILLVSRGRRIETAGMRNRTAYLLVVLLALAGSRTAAQSAAATLRGIVLSSTGTRIPNANVFILETLEGVVTDQDGRFQLSVRDTSVTIVARGIGFTPFTLKVPSPFPDSVIITLERAAPELTPITVVASSYTASEERTATLTPLEVVTIPGTAADVNRALQTLPGIQLADEGTGLFVRGGDAYETKVFLNEASLLNPVDVQSPNGTFMGSVDPFLLDGIVFSSGGFGARFGNALSAAVSLTTQRRPSRSALSASVGFAGLSLSLARPLTKVAGVRVAGNLFDLRPLIAVNGSSRDYDPAPNGHDLSASVIVSSPKAGELTLFAIQKTNKLGVSVDEPSYSGTFGLKGKSNLAVATWKKERGAFTSTVAASAGNSVKDELYGTFDLNTKLTQAQLFAEQRWVRSERLTLRAGGEVERLNAGFEGTIPRTDIDVAPGSRTRVVGSSETGTRSALFVETDARVAQKIRLMTGLRTDRSSLTGESTLDPRISLAYRALGSAHITAAWGIYHQIPDALFFDPVLGDSTLGAMRATHSILGFQAGDNAEMIRVELYRKEYDNLSRQTRDFSVATDLGGESFGADFFLKGTTLLGVRGRITYSYAHSERTDADTRIKAASPYDVPHTLTLVAQRNIAGIEAGIAYRYASGRPFTPVTSATYNEEESRWIPTYGDPSSERLPALRRFDISVSHIRQLVPSWQIVMYASINNLLGRHNVYNYTYSADYSRRREIASLFDRSLYVGATILH